MSSTTLLEKYRYVAVALFLATVLSQTNDCRADFGVGPESMINLFKNYPEPTLASTSDSPSSSVDADDNINSSDSPQSSDLDDTISAILNNTQMRSSREMPPLVISYAQLIKLQTISQLMMIRELYFN